MILCSTLLSAQRREELMVLRDSTRLQGKTVNTNEGKWHDFRAEDRITYRIADSLIAYTTLIPASHWYTSHIYRGQLRVEATASYLAYDIRQHEAPIQGGGFHIAAELVPYGRVFSLLLGAHVAVGQVSGRQIYDLGYEELHINNGSMIKLALPVGLRWTFGHRFQSFFQWTLAPEFVSYQGRGWKYGGGVSYRYYKAGTFQQIGLGANVSSFGVGIRQPLRQHLQLIVWAEGTPFHLETLTGSAFRPYAELHVGLNFKARLK
ncbi:MAG: hypothetical protein JST90_16595 [Bacteroidetes bacterium]|nr:hypothetical protein [Bacteroidota bacterium]